MENADEMQMAIVLWTSIAICVAVFALQMILKLPGHEDFVSDLPPLCLFIRKTTPPHSFQVLRSAYKKVCEIHILLTRL